MIYLLDTDHLSILQRKAGAEYARLSAWMAGFTPADFACCVVVFTNSCSALTLF